MENASKALLMAGTILISLMVISALVFAYRDLTSEKRQEAENQKVEEIAEFNKSFESYGKELKGAQMFSLANKITDYNAKYAGKDGYEAITLTVNSNGNTENAQYYTGLQTGVDNIMKKYKSSNYLEALHEAYEKQTRGSQQEKEQADKTIEEITKKIGDNAKIEHLSKINEEYDTYNKYKTIKNKTFKSDGITYYSNGRIQSMTYRESH